MGDMDDKVCLITGATSGIGRATALGLAERSPERAARTPIFLAADPEAASLNGQYVIDETPRDPNPEARDAAMRTQLWEVSAAMCGLA